MTRTVARPRCPVIGCANRHEVADAMCLECWCTVPNHLQRKVRQTRNAMRATPWYGAGRDDYDAAIAEAIKAVHR